jgi:hypothetical protein
LLKKKKKGKEEEQEVNLALKDFGKGEMKIIKT